VKKDIAMPVQGLGPQFQFASWRAPQVARSIEYPLEVMEEIRAFACDELLQLSHGGDEVGGVLFGTRREDLIRILTWRPIACEHVQGETLQLSYNDRMNLAVQLEVARQNSDLKDLRPLGWFVSHWRGDVALSPSDLEIYNGFFPDSWQVALVVCPKGSGRAQAGFFVRETDGTMVSDASYQCFELEPLRAEPAPTSAAPPEQEAIKPEQVEPQPERPAPPAPAVPDVATAVKTAAPPPPAPASAPVSKAEPRRTSTRVARELPPDTLPLPSFQVEERLPTSERWLWAIPILLALGIAAFLLYQRRAPASLGLRAVNQAQTVELSWDANSRAVRDSDRAEIEINDGGKTSQVNLTGDQLQAGKMSYLPQSSDVGFVITIHPANGEPIHDSTRLIAPVFSAPPAPTQLPQLLPANPPPPTAPPPTGAEHDALEKQVQKLREDLGKERARADELQNLVRILENRLGIPHQPARASRTH
jgi:hypothetical protein